MVLLCGGRDFCVEARRELQRRASGLRIAAVEDMVSAQRMMAHEPPAVILAEERFLADSAESARQRRQALASGLSLLSRHAPVVWIGNAEEAATISPVGTVAAVDFVPRLPLCLPAAVTMVERRLRSLQPSPASGRGERVTLDEHPLDNRDFGEVLRHELNNPLTGILGNAELLLLEVRRQKLDLPLPTVQRLEVITALAVRMRETVRQLSDRWESAGGSLSLEKKPAADQPPSAVSR